MIFCPPQTYQFPPQSWSATLLNITLHQLRPCLGFWMWDQLVQKSFIHALVFHISFRNQGTSWIRQISVQLLLGYFFS